MSSAALLARAVRRLEAWDAWQPQGGPEVAELTELIAWWGLAGYGLQAALRLLAARRLGLRLLWHCLAVSGISLLFFLALGVAASHARAWSAKAKPLAALLLAVAMLGEGCRMLVLQRRDALAGLAGRRPLSASCRPLAAKMQKK